MKKSKKLIALILSFAILLSSFGIGSAAASGFVDSAKTVGASIADNILAAVSVTLDRGLTIILDTILKSVNLSKKGIEDVSTYRNELAEKYSGHDTFAREVSDEAVFSLGYDKRTIMPDDFYESAYYKYGASGIGPLVKYGVEINKTPADLADYYADQYAAEYGLTQQERDEAAEILRERYSADILSVRTVCLDDSRGKVLIASVDCIGLTNESQHEIVKLIDKYCEENGIDDILSVNVTSTHTHSGIDTLGILQCIGQVIDGSLIKAILTGDKLTVPDAKYMEFLYRTVADSMINAYENMEEGELYFSKQDSVIEYTDASGNTQSVNFFCGSDDAVDFISEIYKMTFVPFDRSAKETVIANFATHPEKVGVSSAEELTPTISADFIPFMEQQVNASYDDGCNFIFINSAIGSFIKMKFGSINDVYRQTYPDGNDPLFDTTYENRSMRYGIVIGDFIAAMDKGEKVDPILNVKTTNIAIKCDNPIIRLLAIVRMTNNVILTDSENNVYTATSVGYMEIGSHIKIFMCPGEMNPEVIHTPDHMLSSEYSITREDFQYGPLTDYFAEDDTVLCFGLMNDMAGYIDPDNDYSLVVVRLSDWENPGEYTFNANFNAWLFSYSSDTASTLIGTFLNLVAEANGEPTQDIVYHDYGRVIPHYGRFIGSMVKTILSVLGVK